jgi:hypothetical protein
MDYQAFYHLKFNNMKYLIVLFALFSNSLFAQKIILEKIPKGQESADRFIETEISKDTVWIGYKLFADGENFDTWTITASDIEVSNDTVRLNKKTYTVGKELLVKSKWVFPNGYKYVAPKGNEKSVEAVHKWQIAIIKEKFPDYYNKWFRKK